MPDASDKVAALPEAAPAAEGAAGQPDTSYEILMTAGEAYPRLERLFLGAEREIWASFRLFDPETRLHSPEAKAIGEIWSDLVAHVLDKGVSIHLTLADFDPVMAITLHKATHRSSSILRNLSREKPGRDLHLRTSLHPARVGRLPRMVFSPIVRHKLAKMDPDTTGHAPGFRHAKMLGKPPLIPATHHQKLAVFDRKTLYIGGLDLDERRWDTPEHDRPAVETWQDVQCVVEGPVVAAAQSHLETFVDRVADRKTEVERHPDFLVTLSRKRRVPMFHVGPKPVEDTILQAHFDGIRKARGLIYLETQFLRHMPLAQALCEAAEARPELRLILMLPAAPEDVAFDPEPPEDGRYGELLQTRCIQKLEQGFGDRFFVGSPVQRRAPRSADEVGRAVLHGAPLIYVHTKVSIFDDELAILSSANLNGRSLCWDTEAGVAIRQRPVVRHLRERLFRHWLGESAGEQFFDPATAVRCWASRAKANAMALPPTQREGFLVPYNLEQAERIGEGLPGVPAEMV